MKKVQNLETLKSMQKNELINEMLKDTIKGGSSCANIGPTGGRPPRGAVISNASQDLLDWM